MTISDLRDELSSLYRELEEAQACNDSQWCRDVEEAIKETSKELKELEKELDDYANEHFNAF